MANDVEHFFMCLLALHIYLETCLFKPFVHLVIGLFLFLVLSSTTLVLILFYFVYYLLRHNIKFTILALPLLTKVIQT